MKFQVGDLIKGLPGNGYNITNYNMYKAKVLETFGNGEMNIKILSHKDKTKINEKYWVENSEEHFELINSFTKKDLKDGDIVTYRNGEKRIVNKTENKIVYINDPENLSFYIDNFRNDLTNKRDNEYDIIKVEKVQYKTAFERKEEVLDETEKRYLTGVIRPFRDKVEYMKKHLSTSAKEFIEISIKENISIVLPYFEKGTMYKGMKVNREYTLKELGL
jgi:hypothetical protein